LTTANLAVAQVAGFIIWEVDAGSSSKIRPFPTHKRQMLLQQFALLGQAATEKLVDAKRRDLTISMFNLNSLGFRLEPEV